jgi:hypothetical protein
MGGNALKQCNTHRLGAGEYFALTEKFSALFESVFGFRPVLIKAYKSKPSFGDADYLVQSDLLPPNWTQVLQESFNLSDSQYVKNSNVVSIGYEHFQIDLIVTAAEDIQASEFYFAYNDFGNLIGRIGHKLGIKIGHRGVSLVVRHRERSDHILKEIWLTKDVAEALDILGLDRSIYANGFNSLEDIFKYVASSKYFDPEIYNLEHRSATSRVRDKKRETYNKFLRWVVETQPKTHHNFAEKSELGGYSLRMPYYETEVLTRYPWVAQEVKTLIEDFELDMKFKEVYNGKIVSEQNGFSGKTLGAFMAKMKPLLTKDRKQKWIANDHLVRHNIAQMWMNVGGVQFALDDHHTV